MLCAPVAAVLLIWGRRCVLAIAARTTALATRPKPRKPPSKHVLRCCVRLVFTGAQHLLAQGRGATRVHLRGLAYGLSKPLALRVMAL
jgi:hypothetical protein